MIRPFAQEVYHLFLLFFLPLFLLHATEDELRLIANFPVSAEHYTQVVQKRGLPAYVTTGDLAHCAGIAEKHKTLLQKIGKIFRIDIPPLSHPLTPPLQALVFYNFPDHYLNQHDLRKISKNQLILFQWEPPSVIPEMYQEKITKLFGRIYTWDDAKIDNQCYFKFYYPVWQPMISSPPPFDKKKLCTLVSTDRKSSHPHELYSAREEAITFFEKNHPEDFDLYGRDWDPEKHPLYRGEIADKLGTVKQYRFSICYENMTGIQGYITEKIFDSFSAACIPIYWGATNVSDYIPKDCFIDRREFESLESLYEFLKGMSEKTYEGYLSRIREFLNSDAAKCFLPEKLDQAFYEACVGAGRAASP